jgi:hypothetical protein
MAVTTNKGYPLFATGAEVDAWGALANTNGWSVIDANLGSVTTKSLTNVNVVLSATESQSVTLRLTGVLTGAVQITTACVGFFFVENATTGSFAVTITNGVAGVVAPQSLRMVMIADASNGVRIASSDTFPTGTKCLFFQTTAPTGWTKDTSLNNGTIRLVSGSVGADGGTADFTSAFSARTIARANLPNDSITTSSNGTHNHNMFNSSVSPGQIIASDYASYSNGGSSPSAYTMQGSTIPATLGRTTDDGAHTHTVALNGGVTQTTMDFAVKYADAIRATKA